MRHVAKPGKEKSSRVGPANTGRPLSTYEQKRDPGLTTEPFGGDVADGVTATRVGSFVVHQHDATRMHWDLRLEIGGTLASFAIPKGPTLDPEAKHLAVNTEDHPIEYLDFEDTIPEGQYGAGAMIVWDRGSVTYLDQPAETQKPKGKLDFVLSGMKLRGRFALVKLKKGVEEWLLLKKKDGQEDAAHDILSAQPRSVLSGLTVKELPQRGALVLGLEGQARALGVAVKSGSSVETGKLGWTRPRLVQKAAPSGHVHLALGGVRAFAVKDVRGARIIVDDGTARDVSIYYPELLRTLDALPANAFALDGEIVFLGGGGDVKMQSLGPRLELLAAGDMRGATRDFPATFVAFDVLRVGEADLSHAPLRDRLALLAALVPELGFIRRAPEAEGDPAAFVAFARSRGLPGAIVRSAEDDYAAEWSFLPAAQAGQPFTVQDHGKGGALTLRSARVTNRQKVFFPELGITKGEVVDYYVQIAPVLLPFLADRPLVVVRYPDGIHGKSFFQWNVPQTSPSWLRHVEITSDDGRKKHAFLVDDLPSLIHVVNLGAIPLHILGFREGTRTHCDFFTVDFDVKEAGLGRALPMLKTLRSLLESAGLRGFPKTSGQTGMHVLVPLGPLQSFDVGRALCELFGRLLVAEHPNDATMERVTGRREGKVFIDVGQTGPSRTIVSPYALRATPQATVSMPISWEQAVELDAPSRFTVRTAPALVREHGCAMKDLLLEKPDVGAAVTRLSELLGAKPGSR
jgi:bifunctional non-homologous end joining protein LigD